MADQPISAAPRLVNKPDAEGWWYRLDGDRKRGRFFEVTETEDDGVRSLCVWYSEMRDGFVAVEQLCRPLVRWYGPIHIPEFEL